MIYNEFLFKNRIPLMNRAMDAYALRQQTIAKNIANATTPNYNPERVRFEEYFNDAQVSASGASTDERHIPIGKPDESKVESDVTEAAVPNAEVYFSGESHVNIDKEMSELAQNQIRFRFVARSMKSYFQGMQSAIAGTRI